jgi:hypothetical protein
LKRHPDAEHRLALYRELATLTASSGELSTPVIEEGGASAFDVSSAQLDVRAATAAGTLGEVDLAELNALLDIR